MRKLLTSMVLGGLLAFAGSAWALSLADVGGLDPLVTNGAAKLANSGDALELAWVNSVLGTNYTTMVKYDTPGISSWQSLTDPNCVALQLQDTPAFYFIKTGNVGTFDHFLFSNTNDWAALNLLSSFGEGYEIKGFGKFSHTGELGSTPVPEPGTFLLLGGGLFGLAIFGKRRMKT
jgi:hypothetical protein